MSNGLSSSRAVDVVVIGGGSAGYAAASRAASRGASVAVIEGGDRVGGLCILRGCMPTKAILESSHRFHDLHRANEFGLSAEKIDRDIAAIVARKNRLIGEFAEYRYEQLKKGSFRFLRGVARFEDAHHLLISCLAGETERLEFKSAIIATGSVIAGPKIPGLDEVGFLDSDRALDLTRLPKSIAVLGGGAVAVEFAQHFNRLGAQTSLIQRSNHILREMDSDIAEVIETVFRREGMHLFTGTQLLRVERAGDLKRIVFKHGDQERSVEVEEILQALGRKPNIDGLHLEGAGIKSERGAVVVDPAMRTNVPHIYAVGDVNGLIEVVHIAIQQGEIAGINATGGDEKWDDRLKATVVFTDPQAATAGLSESELKAKNQPYFAASYPFSDHGKSMIHGATDGFVKLMCDCATGEIVGGAVVGPAGGELIHEIIVAMALRATVEQFTAIPHYHPTLAEIWTYPSEELRDRVRAHHC